MCFYCILYYMLFLINYFPILLFLLCLSHTYILYGKCTDNSVLLAFHISNFSRFFCCIDYRRPLLTLPPSGIQYPHLLSCGCHVAYTLCFLHNCYCCCRHSLLVLGLVLGPGKIRLVGRSPARGQPVFFSTPTCRNVFLLHTSHEQRRI